MRSRLCSILVLLCLLLLEGCATKNIAPPAPAGRFPDQPVLALAKKPDQGLPEAAGRQAFSIDGGWGFRQADALSSPCRPDAGRAPITIRFLWRAF